MNEGGNVHRMVRETAQRISVVVSFDAGIGFVTGILLMLIIFSNLPPEIRAPLPATRTKAVKPVEDKKMDFIPLGEAKPERGAIEVTRERGTRAPDTQGGGK